MDETYDVIVCGTGLKECMLAALLSHTGQKVLQVDENSYYGGENASLNLTNLFKKFEAKPPAPSKPSDASTMPSVDVPEDWGANRDWNIDLIPKFMMARGKLTQMLILTGVKEYLQFQVVEGSYVYQHKTAGWFSGEKFIHKVPASDTEALSSSLIPSLEKLRGKNFFMFIASFRPTEPATHKGFNPDKTTMREVFEYFGIQPNVVDFVGHSIALYDNDDYLDKPMGATMERLRLYMLSLVRYGKSPFIYPMYGLGSLSEGFSRLAAVFGCTYMLNTPVAEVVFSNTARVSGVRNAEGSVAKCTKVIASPENIQKLLPMKVRKTGQVLRVINVLNAPIPNTNNRSSCQIILPQKQLNRSHDIYVAMMSHDHGVCAAGKYVALVSTTIETADPLKEVAPALSLLGPIEKQFVQVSDLLEAVDDGTQDNVRLALTQMHTHFCTPSVRHTA